MQFVPGSVLATKLLATRAKPLMEGNTWNDAYWGVKMPGCEGQNMLGVLLEERRAELAALGNAARAPVKRAAKRQKVKGPEEHEVLVID